MWCRGRGSAGIHGVMAAGIHDFSMSCLVEFTSSRLLKLKSKTPNQQKNTTAMDSLIWTGDCLKSCYWWLLVLIGYSGFFGFLLVAIGFCWLLLVIISLVIGNVFGCG